MRVIVPTCNQYLWAVRPFAWLFNRYWSEMQPVLVGGFQRPEFDLPDNITFRSIDKENYPADRWSDGMMRLLKSIDDHSFVLMLEDYWLVRGVDHAAVESLGEYMRIHDDVLRIDLTADRLHSGRAFDVDTWGHLDIIETPKEAPYQWSTQACIVNRAHMLRCLKPGIAPWEFELRGNELIPDGLRVLGTRQWPVRYINALGMGCTERYRTEHIRDGLGGRTIERIEPRHVKAMRAEGVLPEL